jgi:hypothetical protein
VTVPWPKTSQSGPESHQHRLEEAGERPKHRAAGNYRPVLGKEWLTRDLSAEAGACSCGNERPLCRSLLFARMARVTAGKASGLVGVNHDDLLGFRLPERTPPGTGTMRSKARKTKGVEKAHFMRYGAVRLQTSAHEAGIGVHNDQGDRRSCRADAGVVETGQEDSRIWTAVL